MKYNILKRLEAVEQAAGARKKKIPDSVIITWDDYRGKCKVIEVYATGERAQDQTRTKEAFIDSYKDYIFKPGFMGKLVLWMFSGDAEEAPPLIVTTGAEIRKEEGLEEDAAFSFGDIVEDPPQPFTSPRATADIIPHGKGAGSQ